jgi:hypothetical protein
MKYLSRKALAVLAPLTLIGALFALPAFAQATVTLRSGSATGTPLAVGAEVKGVSSNLVFTLSTGSKLECAENTLNGAVETNTSVPANVKINTATFTGAGGGACKTSISGVTADVTANPPWVLHVEPKDKFTLTGPIKFTAALTLGGFSIATCVFERAGGITGTYATGGQAILTVGSSQTFTKLSGSTELCGTEGVLTGSFAPNSKGVAVWVTEP